jgi:hypothetical protein
MFGVPNDAKKGRWRSREQDVRRQSSCGRAKQKSSQHGEYSAGLNHQLAKQCLEIGDEICAPRSTAWGQGATTSENEAERV